MSKASTKCESISKHQNIHKIENKNLLQFPCIFHRSSKVSPSSPVANPKSRASRSRYWASRWSQQGLEELWLGRAVFEDSCKCSRKCPCLWTNPFALQEPWRSPIFWKKPGRRASDLLESCWSCHFMLHWNVNLLNLKQSEEDKIGRTELSFGNYLTADKTIISKKKKLVLEHECTPFKWSECSPSVLCVLSELVMSVVWVISEQSLSVLRVCSRGSK